MRYLNYITENYFDSSAWEGQSKIDTGIAHTSPTMSVRIKYKPKFGPDPYDVWLFCDRIVGYSYAEDSDADSSFRIFGWNGGCFDYDYGRWSGLNLTDPSLEYDVTFGDCYLLDNTNDTYLVQETPRGTVPSNGAHIYVDVNWTYVNEVIITDGETVVFDGKAAIDDNGHIGLWDEISQTLKYNPDLEMTYIDNVDCTDCSNWEECGYESYEDCQCQQYGECLPDCTDCTNWQECGYESLEECQNTHKVNLLPSTMNRIHLQISGGGWPDERIYIGDIYVWDDDDNEKDSYIEVYVNNGRIGYYDNDWDDDFGRYVVETHTDNELIISFEPEERGWYIEFEQSFDNCEDWESRGYESYSDCDCQNNQICPPEPDCTDCNNWEECGYESYDDCQCQQYGICPPEPVEHLKIVDVLRGILIEMTDDEECELASWQYNDMATSNVKLDNKKPSPTAVFYQITDFVYDLTTGIKREKANVLVAFLQKEVKLDAEGLEQDKIIKKMSEIAFEFLKKVTEEGSLRVLNDKITLKSTFIRSDSNRTGVVMELELEEKSGTCF